MRKRLIFAALILVAALPLAAQSNDVGLWIAAARIHDTTDLTATLGFDDARGFGASINHYWTSHLSTELAATALKSKRGRISVDGVDILDLGELRLTPITAALQFHLARSSRFDVYAGGGAAYVLTDDLSSSDLDLSGIGTVHVEDGATWMANAGATFGFSERWGVAVDAKYIAFRPDSTVDAPESMRLDLKPLVLSAGVRIRF
ncbi:MAG TPA: OmpW family outer membrane protein [Thermoanaerobaculia bacterium]|jgi:outer membrane protein W|nr:OmpW family outer membrane protein [Thermoanaerobaculia bacterium]